MNIEKIKRENSKNDIRKIAGGIVIKEDKILLIKRRYKPNIGEWCIPAGFTEKEKNESVKDCCVREIKEETNIDVDVIKEIEVFKKYHKERNRYEDMHIFSCVPKSSEIIVDDEVIDAKWIKLNELKETNVIPEIREIILNYLQGEI